MIRRVPRAARVHVCSLMFAALALAGCGGRNAVPKDEFRYSEQNGISTLDPAQMSYLSAIRAGLELYAGLVQLDSLLNPVPWLARSWETTDGGTSIVFHLRTDARFVDDPCFAGGIGRRVTAEDVRYSLTRICDPRVASTGWWVFAGRVVGADAFHESTERVGNVAGFEARDDSTFVLRLVRPFAPMLAVLTMPYGFIVAREACEKYGADFFQHPVGCGPFALEDWRPGLSIVLKRNTTYFERDAGGRVLPRLERISISFMRDAKTEFLEFREGRLDALMSLDNAAAENLIDSAGRLTDEFSRFQLLTVPELTTEYYGILLDTALPAVALPLAQSRMLRQALNWAVDREAIVRYVLRGRAVPATHGFLPPGMPGYDTSVRGYGFDPDRARQLLAEAGFPDGRGLPLLTLQLGTSELSGSVAEAVQEQWKRVGIRCDIRQVDFPQHLSMVRDGRLAIWRTQWVGDYPDPENFLSLFVSRYRSPGGPNTTHYEDRVVDSLYDCSVAGDPKRVDRYRLTTAAAQRIVDDAPWVFLYHPVVHRLLQPSIEGIHVDPLGRMVLKEAWKK